MEKDTDIIKSLQPILYKINEQIKENTNSQKYQQKIYENDIQDFKKDLEQILNVLKNGMTSRLVEKIEQSHKNLTDKIEKLAVDTNNSFLQLTATIGITNELLKERNELDKQRFQNTFELKKLRMTGWLKIIAITVSSGGVIYLFVKELLK